jgi:FemAB-related protein (PEP-CTERM system-associated)
MKIRLLKNADSSAWDSYVINHPRGTHCHLAGWKGVIEKTYGHAGYYLMAEEGGRIVGVLPLMHIKSLLFGCQLVSMPFLNYGGILADSEQSQNMMIEASIDLRFRLKASSVELRHQQPFNLNDPGVPKGFTSGAPKLRMVLELPDSSEALLQSIKSKLRSQIRRPQKEGMTAAIGGGELLDDFYRVFSVNMRDLGSPVHSKTLFTEILKRFDRMVRIGVVRYQGECVAAGLIVCFRDTVEIPWASSLRSHSRCSPNMLLYWTFMDFSCKNGYRNFDFGRTIKEKGTYKFKEQWGARPIAMSWCVHGVSKNGAEIAGNDAKRMMLAAAIWQKLPVALANLIGPKIRGSISL